MKTTIRRRLEAIDEPHGAIRGLERLDRQVARSRALEETIRPA